VGANVAGEGESDAGAWVDQRQDSVTDPVNENNLDAVSGW
jgi:hypothetical protein